MAPIWNGDDGFDSGDPIGGFPFLPIRKPILPRNPVKAPPATTNPPGQGLPAQVRAVLHSVAPNDKTPTTCSVLLENRMPPRNGVTLPAGFGPVYKAGTVNAPGPFYNDPQTLEGGSWVLVDTKNNVVINVLQGVSQSIPSSSAWFTQTHVHTGAQDAFGNPMPGQVDLTSHTQGNLPGSKLYPLPGGFAFTATAANQAYSATSGGAYTCKFDLTVTATANVGTPSQYLDRIEVYTAPTGTTHYSLNTIIKTNAFGAFTGVAISGLGSGVAYDVYVHVVAKQPGSYLVSGSVFTTAAQTMGVGSFASGPGTAPTITAASYTARPIGRGVIQRLAVSITETDFTTPVPSWANSLIIGLRENGSGATTFTGMHRVLAAKSSTTGVYSATLFAGTGDTVDVGVCYVDAQGNQSAITWPASLSAIADANGDFFDSGNTYRTVLHTRHSPGVTGVIDSAGTLDVSKARTSTILPRANTHSSITNAIDTNSNFICTEFTGGYEKADGSCSGIDAKSSVTQYTLALGQPFTVSGDIAKGTAAGHAAIILGNVTNGYSIRSDAAGNLFISKYVAGVLSNIGSGVSTTTDTSYHSFRLTVTPGATANTLEGSIDGSYFSATDTALTLTTGTWPVTVLTGGSAGTMQHYTAGAAAFHRSGVHPDYSGTVNVGGGIDFTKANHVGKVLSNIADDATFAKVKATELASGTVKQLNDGTNVRTAAALAGTINSSADTYGSYNKAGSIHRGALEAPGQPGASNLIYNPTFLNGFIGWGRYQGSGANVGWYTDGFGGGRCGMSGGSLPANGADLYQQTVKPAFFGQPMVYSAIVEVDSALPSGSFVFMQVQEVPGSQTYTASVTGPDANGKSRMTVILPFTTTSSNTSLLVKVGIQGNSSTATTVPNISFQKLQLEYGTQPTTYVDHTATSLVHTTIQKALGVDGSNPYMTKNQNLVFNGDMSLYTVPTGVQSPFASAIRPTDSPNGTPNGWSRGFEAGGAGEGSMYRITNAVNAGCSSGDYALLLQDSTSGGNYSFGAVSDAFPVVAGRQYTLSADVWPGFASGFPSGACWYMRVVFYKAGATDFSRNSASLSGNVPVLLSSACTPSSGAPPTWSANGVVDIVSNYTANGQMFHPTGTLVAPSDAAYCRVAFYHWGNTTSAWNLSVSNVKCVEAWSSSSFNGQGSMCTVGGVPSSLPYSSTTTSVTLNLPAATLTYADQSVASVSASSPSFSGLSASHTYYVIVGINTATKQWTAYLSSSQYSGTQIVQNIAGDGYIPVWQNATVTTPASGTGGGAGSGGGGLNGGGSCPATWQRVFTREVGWVRADEVEVGMHLPTKGGTWTRVLDAVKLPAPIWSYTLASKGNVSESFDVNDTHAVQLTNGDWLMAKDMRGGEEVVGEPTPFTIAEAHYVKDAHYIAFTVEEPHEFMLGGALCHNATTL